MKVLVSGGGIAGNAVAFWLSKLGHDVTVIEWFPSLRATGLQVDLRGHAVEVLKRMGLESAFRAKSVMEHGMQIVDTSGRRRGFFPVNKSGKGVQDFSTEHEIMRGDLCRIIYDATKDRAKYIFGTSIAEVAENDGGVAVRFKDGQADTFDLLVGADGQSSRTRKIMLRARQDHGFIPIRIAMSYFTMASAAKDGEEYLATWYFAPGKRFVMTRRHCADSVQVYLSAADEARSERLMNAGRGDVEEQKAAMAEIFKGAGWEVDKLVQGMLQSNDFYLERLGVVKLKSWFNGRVVLVGDAAYCPSANTGMGTTSAIVGAYILAGEIGRHTSTKTEIVAAFKSYERKFMPFMDQVQKGVAEDGGMSFPSSKFGVAVIYWIVGVVSFFRLNVIGSLFLREKVKNWHLPEYKEMV